MEKYNNNRFVSLIKEKPLKFSLINNIIFNESYEQEQKSISNLISKYDDIKKLMELNEPEIIKFFYFIKEKIHDILYDEKKNINIKPEEKNKNISYNYYLNLLINDNIEIVNYLYSIDYINEINNIKIEKEDKFKSIMISKIIIELINNYKYLSVYDNNDNEKMKNIIKEKEEIINNNIYIFQTIGLDFDINYIKITKIDKIYI